MSENIELAASAMGDKHVQQARMEDRFGPFIAVLQKQVATLLALYKIEDQGAVVGTAANVTGDELYEIYLNSFEDEQVRQDHKCRCCRDFFRRSGTLIQLAAGGQSHSLLFQDSEEVPELYRPFVRAAAAKLTNARINTVLTAKRKGATVDIGEARKGGFEHFHFELAGVAVRAEVVLDTYQTAAAIKEDVRLLNESFGRWTLVTLKRAKALFENDVRLARSQFSEIVPTFMDIREASNEIKHHNVRHNYVVSRAVASRKGVVRIGQSVVGEFLDKLQAISNENVAIQHFLAMTDKAGYMRPSAAPAAGAVAQAEKLFAELELAPSLRRRAMRRDELTRTFWKQPVVEEKPVAGLFGGIKTKDGVSANDAAVGSDIQAGKISVMKLHKLIQAEGVTGIELMIPGGHTKIFSSLTTAVDPDSKPILRWDDEERRNPACAYSYTNPVHPSTWGLTAYQWASIVAVIPEVNLFGIEVLPEDVLVNARFVLAEGYDHNARVNLPLFPETLRAELHGVRSVVEAYARANVLEEVDKGMVVAQCAIGLKFRLTRDGVRTVYEIASVE